MYNPFEKLNTRQLGLFSQLPDDLLQIIECSVCKYNNEEIERMLCVLVKNDSLLRKVQMKNILKHEFNNNCFSPKVLKVLKV
tara:strand:- start:1827 stop:2072 length:246 start_codon:yes stop_codon:yes gene_type:complete